jgi:MoaD family protein
MVAVRFFAQAREATGTAHSDVERADTVGDVVASIEARYGEPFRKVLPICRIWVNGQPATYETPIADSDEVAFLPPVSGG